MDRWDKRVAQWMIRGGLLRASERIDAERRGVLRILAYHRIADPEQLRDLADPAMVSATPESFAEQMAFLAENYHVLSVEELLAVLDGRQTLPSRSVLVTFDDGYRDFAEHAWPVLERLGLPAILFVATSYLDSDGGAYWWDRLYRAIVHSPSEEVTLFGSMRWSLGDRSSRHRAYRGVRSHLERLEHDRAMGLLGELMVALGDGHVTARETLTWAEVEALSSAGLCIAAHTRTHPVLSQLAPRRVRDEVVGSQQDLRDHLGHVWPIFCYPVGHKAHMVPQLLPLLRDAGYRSAVTMLPGHNVLGRADPLRLSRMGMAAHLTMEEFRLALTFAYDVYSVFAGLRERPTIGHRADPERNVDD
jgi:peptidoglycan/xylan/chitin deacetylase (PgdA/CDA1 family)